MRIYWLLAVGLLIAGCDRGHRAAENTPLPETQKFFIDWLEAHGETNVIADANGVGLKGNPTRLKASLYHSNLNNSNYVAEVQFDIQLPGGGEIVDFVAGMGKTEKLALQDALANFTLTTFHVIYKAFVNSSDEHQTLDPMMFANGERHVAVGNLYMRSSSKSEQVDLNALNIEIEKALSTFSPSPKAHWIKLVYAQNKGDVISLEATVDNAFSQKLTDKLTSIPWPKSEEFCLIKQFIVIQPVDAER